MTDPEVRRWWPATQSFELVEASMTQASEAVCTELQRFHGESEINSEWQRVSCFGDAMGLVKFLTTSPTDVLLLPTLSRWTVIWSNSFLCDGWDSLCYNITKNHGLTTLHWSAHDAWTTFQSGASFTFRRQHGVMLQTRSVYVGQEDKRWLFHEAGDALPEEDVAAYGAKRKRDRLNEASMIAFLERLGARPWSSDFYAFATADINLLRWTSLPEVILKSRRTWDQVLTA